MRYAPFADFNYLYMTRLNKVSYITSNRMTRTMIHQIQVNGLSSHQNAAFGIPFISQTSFPASATHIEPTSSLRLPRGAALGRQCLQIPQDFTRGGKHFSRVSPCLNAPISRVPLHILRTKRQYSTRHSDTQLKNAPFARKSTDFPSLYLWRLMERFLSRVKGNHDAIGLDKQKRWRTCTSTTQYEPSRVYVLASQTFQPALQKTARMYHAATQNHQKNIASSPFVSTNAREPLNPTSELSDREKQRSTLNCFPFRFRLTSPTLSGKAAGSTNWV
jgi:hypothetical protein